MLPPYPRAPHSVRVRPAFLAATLAIHGLSLLSASGETGSSATGLLVGKTVGTTALDRAWSSGVLYKNDANPLLQLLQLNGRIHLQSMASEANGQHFDTSDFKNSGQDENVWGNDLEVRRLRFGFRSLFLHAWKIEGDFNVDIDAKDGPGGSFTPYKSIQELSLTYMPTQQFTVGLGKKLVRYSRDFELSSNDMPTIERGLLASTITPGDLTGIWSAGRNIGEHWLYELGLFSNARARAYAPLDDEGILSLGKIGYDFSKATGFEKYEVTLTYMHNSQPGYRSAGVDPNYTFVNSPSFTDSFALTQDLTVGKFRLITEINAGIGFTGTAHQGAAPPTAIAQPNLFGVTLTPCYFLTDQLEAVYRFQIVTASGPDGIRVPLRYQRLVPADDEFGNTYVSHYIGLNYLIHGYKLQLMNGIEYAQLGGGDYHGVTATTALRFFF